MSSVRRLFTVIIFATAMALALGCTPAPPLGQQPDDIVPTPGGMAYRANVHQQGVKDPWPPIQSSTLVAGDNVTIIYRADIETRAGESRNNIIFMRIPGRPSFDTRDLRLFGINVPAGMVVREGEAGGGLPSWMTKVLVIEISQDVKPGEYSFEINVEFEGKSYAKIPCTVRVV